MVTQKIKIEKELDITELDGEKVTIDFESGKYFMIKGAGNDILDIMKDGCTVEYIVDELLTIYDVDRETCQISVEKFMNNMVENNFISLYA